MKWLHMYWWFEKNEHTFYHHSGLKMKKNEHNYSLFGKIIKKMEILVFPEKKIVSITENLEISFTAFCCISKFSLFFAETFFWKPFLDIYGPCPKSGCRKYFWCNFFTFSLSPLFHNIYYAESIILNVVFKCT